MDTSPGIKTSRKTQRSQIFRLLKSNPGTWVACYLLAEISLQYNTRIHELRKAGAVISNRREHHNGQVLSWYRLEESESTPKTAAEPSSIFPEFTGVHRDETDISPDLTQKVLHSSLWPSFKRRLQVRFRGECWIAPMRLFRAMRATDKQVHLLAALPPNNKIITGALSRLAEMREMLAPNFNLSLTKYPA